VAVGRLQPPSLGSNPSGSEGTSAPVVEFISRHTIDGKFLFVDQRYYLTLFNIWTHFYFIFLLS